MPDAVMTDRFVDALAWASRRHTGQARHNTGTPYLSHLLSTSAIVIEERGSEDAAIAALLHDVLEDQPVPRAQLRQQFGAEIYRIVDDCTDADLGQRAGLDWRSRKEAHLARMSGFAEDSLLVIAADKVSSLQALCDDVARYGFAIFDRSQRPIDDLLWNYSEVSKIIEPHLQGRAVLQRLLELIEKLSKQR